MMPNTNAVPLLAPVRAMVGKFFKAPSPEEAYLNEQRRSGSYAFIHINKCGGTSVEKALGLPKIHDTARQRRDVLGVRRWEQLYSFALVRHPFDKVCSHYRYRVKTNQTGLGDRPVPLNEFIERAYGSQDPSLFDKPLMFAPCIDWLTDLSGKIIVTRIARLEDIATEWPQICANIGADVPFPQANRTERDSATSELTSDSKALIERIFARDFEMFGY